MSDMTIPGVTSNYNTDKMIEELMKVERIPLNRMEAKVETYKTQKSAWQEVSRNLSSFKEAAKALYGFQNPFMERIANSSNESILTASVDRETPEEEIEVSVKQTAKADKFLSSSVSRDFKVPEGNYTCYC